MLAKAKGGKSRNKKKKSRDGDDKDEEDEDQSSSASTTNPEKVNTYVRNEPHVMSNTMKIALLVIGIFVFIGGCIKAYSMMFWTAPTKTATEKHMMRQQQEELKKKD